MRAAFHAAAFKETTDAFGKTVAAVAAGTAAAAEIETFWQNDKKPEELRAALLRQAFKAACQAGEKPAAVYMLSHYPEHLNIAEIKKAAISAVAGGHDALALHLTRKITAADDRKDAPRAAEIVLAGALEKGSAGLVENLLTLLPQTDSTQLYRTALGNRPDNMRLVLNHCRARGLLAQDDLDRSLVIAVKNKNLLMAQELLASGADADGCRKAPLKRVAEWADADEKSTAQFLPLLIGAGADPFLAQETFAAKWQEVIAQTAQETRQRHFDALASLAGKTPDVNCLRSLVVMPAGMGGLHYAARHRLLDRLLLTELTSADLDSADANGQSLTQMIEQSGAWQNLLQPAKWIGRKEVLQHFVGSLSEKAQEKTDLAALLHDVDMLTLRNRARGLSLKPKSS